MSTFRSLKEQINSTNQVDYIDWIVQYMLLDKELEDSFRVFLEETNSKQRCFVFAQWARWLLTKKDPILKWIHNSQYESIEETFLLVSPKDLSLNRLRKPITEEGIYLFSFSGNEDHEAIVQIKEEKISLINSWGGFDKIWSLKHEPHFWWHSLVLLNQKPAEETVELIGQLFGPTGPKLMEMVDPTEPFFPQISWERL